VHHQILIRIAPLPWQDCLAVAIAMLAFAIAIVEDTTADADEAKSASNRVSRPLW
jgi:hypothetical protein